MKFATKKDIIKTYASKRKVVFEEDVEDLLNTFLDYTLEKITAINDKGEFAYLIDGLGTIYEPEFDPRNLTTREYSKIKHKTENMLHEYILTGLVKPKKDINIKDDFIHRI